MRFDPKFNLKSDSIKETLILQNQIPQERAPGLFASSPSSHFFNFSSYLSISIDKLYQQIVLSNSLIVYSLKR